MRLSVLVTPLVGEDANMNKRGRVGRGCIRVGRLISLEAGTDGAFFGHKCSSLQTVTCPLQFFLALKKKKKRHKNRWARRFFDPNLRTSCHKRRVRVCGGCRGQVDVYSCLLCTEFSDWKKIYIYIKKKNTKQNPDVGLYEVPLFVERWLARVG